MSEEFDKEQGIWPPKVDLMAGEMMVGLKQARSVFTTLDSSGSVNSNDYSRAVAALDFALRQCVVERETPRLQRRISSWADRIFPQRTSKDIILKLFEEVGEVLKNPDDKHELADVFILILDLAQRAEVDIIKAAHEKMEINEKRTWSINKLGIMKHESD